MRTIGRHIVGPKRNNWIDICDYCGVPYPRHRMKLDGDGLLRCPQRGCANGASLKELAEIAASNASQVDTIKAKTRTR